jgi:L-alanine-DL-glutamate epimerase-like enolase superfamily enzyme
MSPAIEQVDLSVFRIPLDEPESDGTLTWDATDVVVAEPVACRALAQDVLLDVVVGRPADDVVGTWHAMVKAVRNAGRPGVASAAIAAVDLGLWDLKAKLHQEPLCRLLGQARPSAPIYGSGGFTSLTDDQLVAQFTHWAHDQHIPRVKMKIGTSWGTEPERDLARVALARRAIGDDVELYVDANGGYTRKQAVRVARRLDELGVVWFEEPVSSDDLDGLRAIRLMIAADVAAGEYGYDLAYFQRLCAAGAVDVLQADVTRCAGVTEWLRAAAVAAAHNLQISGHCAPSAHLHAACAVPNLRHLEYFADHVRADQLLFDGVVEPVDGALTPADRPGLGLSLKTEGLDRYRLEP